MRKSVSPSPYHVLILMMKFNFTAMMHAILLIVFLLGFPALVLISEKRVKLVRWISPIIICYLVGILAGNLPFLDPDLQILEKTSGLSVFLAIPLLLFSTNLPSLLRHVRPALFSFSLGVFSVMVVATLAFLIFRFRVENPATVAGMMVGVYTGGTQNMSAIGIGLGVEEEVFALLNTADVLFSGIYFLILLSFARRLPSWFLPVKTGKESDREKTLSGRPGPEETFDEKGRPRHVLIGLALASSLVGMAIGISWLIRGDILMPVVILVVTSLGIASSFIRKVRSLPLTFTSANYLLLVFALAMGSMADFTELVAAGSGLFLFCGFVVFGSVLLHFLLAAVFRVDRDTLIITSTAAIFGPLFIGPVAGALGNRQIISIGIALGLIGIALGNYLGLGLAYLLK